MTLRHGLSDSILDDDRDAASRGMVSTSGVLVAGKLRVSRESLEISFRSSEMLMNVTVVLRQTLARLFSGGPLTTSELAAMRNEFRLLGEDLASRIARIPESDPLHIADSEEVTSTYEDSPALNRWARLLLSAYIDQKYCLVCHPVLKTPVGHMWTDLYPQ